MEQFPNPFQNNNSMNNNNNNFFYPPPNHHSSTIYEDLHLTNNYRQNNYTQNPYNNFARSKTFTEKNFFKIIIIILLNHNL